MKWDQKSVDKMGWNKMGWDEMGSYQTSNVTKIPCTYVSMWEM